MKSKNLIVISLDAVSSGDLEDLSDLPNLKEVIENGAFIKNVESVYPTLTYPAHASIITGRYPKNHGIVDNTIFKPGNLNPNWYWYKKYIKGDTIIDLASRKRMRTCSLLWPVTGGAKIDYNFPEIFPVRQTQNQIVMSLKAGSIFYQYNLNKKYGHIRRGIEQPFLDDFVMKCLEDTIENIMPELILVHFTDVDANKHLYGASSVEAREALRRHDKRLGLILKKLKDEKILEKTDIILLGDHGAKDVSKFVRLNKVFVDKGFINLSRNNCLLEYDAYCKSLDGAAYIYLRDPSNKRIKENVKRLLEDFKNKSGAIKSIYDEEKINECGADTNASFMLDASDDFYFVDDFEGEVIEKVKDEEVGKVNHRYKGLHGYSPRRSDYKTFFLAYGKDFKSGEKISSGKIINHGPTIAKLLGGELRDCDGEVEYDIFA